VRRCCCSAAVWPGLLSGAQALSTAVFDPLGQVFLRLLFFVVIPLIFASLALGVAQLGELSRLGPLAGRTFTLFFANMLIAVALGLVMMNIVQPGASIDADTRERLVAEYGGAAERHIERQAQQPDMSAQTLVDMFMPRNLFAAFIGNDRNMLGDVLPLILFAILVGPRRRGCHRCGASSCRAAWSW
jgi:Na+/H+-dicarboxylate symporter